MTPTRQNEEPHLLSLLGGAIDFGVYRIAVDPEARCGGRVASVSPSIRDIIGIEDPSRLDAWFEQIHPDDLARVIEANHRSWQQRTRCDEVARFYNANRGKWLWIRMISAPVFDAQGELVHFAGLVLDITEQKQAEEELRTRTQENERAQEALRKARDVLEQRVNERTRELELTNESLRSEIEQRRCAEESLQLSQALYSEVFDHSPLQMFIQEVLPDGRFRILRTNPAHQEASGMPPEKIWGKTVEDLVIPEVAQTITRHYLDCIEAGHPIEYEEQGPSPYWNLERIRTFRTTLAPVYDSRGNVVRLVGASEDITDQKRAERIIMERTRDEAIAAERGRLARELHDAVTQTLFSTALTADVLPKIWENDAQAGQAKLAELRELTRGALAEMRTLLMELRPDALAEANLQDLLRHLTNAFIARTRIPTSLLIDGDSVPPVDVKIAFYRIAQEALNNIARHTDPERVTLSLVSEPGQTELALVDDGQGFDLRQAPGADHHGLRIMHERAEEVGADLEITSQIGKGTCIHLRWADDRYRSLSSD